MSFENMKYDVLNQKIEVGDYVFTDVLDGKFGEMKLQIFEVVKLTTKNVRLKKINKAKAKEIYRNSKCVIKFNKEQYPELFI